MLSRIIVCALGLLLVGCERQQQIERCVETCNVTACRPNGAGATRESDDCRQCVIQCNEVP